MSGPPPPPPPPPPGWHPRPQSYSNFSNYGVPTYSNSSQSSLYGQPPPQQTSTSAVPPPLYGYSGSNHQPNGQTNTFASSNSWDCKACQVTLESEAALQAHTTAHVKCTQCSFSASRKVVNGHFQSAHGRFAGSGFKTVTVAIPGCRVQRFRICVGNRPEDVQQWIAERRKRFPRRQPTPEAQQNEKQEPKPAAALGSLLDGYGSSSSSDSDDGNAQPKAKTAVESSTANASMDAPMNDASTKDPNNRDSVASVANSGNIAEHPSNYRTRPCRYFMRNGSCRNGDVCNFSHEIGSNGARPKSKRRHQKRSSSSSTLLRKLLENDARREATLTLQLLDYLADCNYLQKQRNGADR